MEANVLALKAGWNYGETTKAFGTTFKVVSADAPGRRSRSGAESRHPTARTYIAVSGDSLWTIAERFYGDGRKCYAIVDTDDVPNPDSVYFRQVLTIP